MSVIRKCLCARTGSGEASPSICETIRVRSFRSFDVVQKLAITRNEAERKLQMRTPKRELGVRIRR